LDNFAKSKKFAQIPPKKFHLKYFKIKKQEVINFNFSNYLISYYVKN